MSAPSTAHATATTPAARARATFTQCFGGSPELLVRAPGRVNLIGEFTDYNDGFCLPVAIDRETVVAARARRDDSVYAIAADDRNSEDRFVLSSTLTPVVKPQWANYVRGVFAALRAQGAAPGGVELVIAGNVPQGAGLSSSAALEIAVGDALRRLFKLPLDGVALAKAGQRAEHEFAGCRCGIMDQMASALAQRDHALLLDCRSLQTQAVPMPAGVVVLVIDSRIQRGLVDSEYNQRRQQCEASAAHFGVPALRDVSVAQWQAAASTMDPLLARRSKHVVTENARTQRAAQCLAAGDLQGMAELMAQSHASMRDDFEVSLPAIDALVDIVARCIKSSGQAGGVRLTGGGFGGCVVALVPQALVADIEKAVAQHYRSPTGLPAIVHQCHATRGVSALP